MDRTGGQHGGSDGRRLAIAAGVAILAAFAWHSMWLLQTDVSYFLMAAERILDGARPYRDILETNPPLIFWLTLPPVWLARLLGLPSTPVFVAAVCLLIAGCSGLAFRILAAGGDRRAAGLTAALAAGLAAFLPNDVFGQREHLIFISALPYVACALRRAEGGGVAAVPAVAAGAIFGVGLALKPHFVAVPALIEIWLLFIHRDLKRLFRAETLAMAVPLVVYPGIVWLATPEYFTVIIPLVRLTYGAFDLPLPALLLRLPFLLSMLFFIIAAAALALLSGKRAGQWVWIVAGAGAIVAYLLQAKGFVYHSFPLRGFALVGLLLAVELAGARALRNVAFAAVAALIVNGDYLFAVGQNQKLAILRQAMGDIYPRKLLVMSHDIGVPFPYMQADGIAWASSYPSLWTLPAVVRGEVPASEKPRLIAEAAEMVAGDLNRHQPDTVLIDRRAKAPRIGQEIPYLDLFAASPSFAAAWRPYRLAHRVGDFEVWQRGD